MKVAIIGGGVMGEAILHAALEGGANGPRVDVGEIECGLGVESFPRGVCLADGRAAPWHSEIGEDLATRPRHNRQLRARE